MIDREDMQILTRLVMFFGLFAAAVAGTGAAMGLGWALFEITRGLT
jgi:hypothetical protein